MNKELKVTVEGKVGTGTTALIFAIGEVCEKYGIKALFHDGEEYCLPMVKSLYKENLNHNGKDMTVHLHEKTNRKINVSE